MNHYAQRYTVELVSENTAGKIVTSKVYPTGSLRTWFGKKYDALEAAERAAGEDAQFVRKGESVGYAGSSGFAYVVNAR